MDHRQRKHKKKLFDHFSTAASVVNFQAHNQPFSPVRDHHRRYGDASSHSKLRGFSGPMVPVIPEEVRRRRNSRYDTEDAADDEPTSPKISCIGQIKHKKEMKRRAHAAAKAEKAAADLREKQDKVMSHKKGSGSYSLKKIFNRSTSDVSDSTSATSSNPIVGTDRSGHSLNQMKKLASGRDGLRDFDWASHRPPPESPLPGSDSDGDDEPIIPFSAPMRIGVPGGSGGINLKPREEINLWKRRPMPRPAPLVLH